MLIEQAIVRVRQAAVRLEPGRFARRHDRRQTRMLGHHKAPAQGLMHQPDRRQRAQAVAIQAQQAHRAAAKVLAQGMHQTLQAHGVGQFDDQVGKQTGFQHGSFHLIWLKEPYSIKVKLTITYK